MQELVESCTTMRAEYHKATKMLMERVQECQSKDAQLEKLKLANTRLQGLCRALRAEQGDALGAAAAADRVPLAEAPHEDAQVSNADAEGQQTSASTAT